MHLRSFVGLAAVLCVLLAFSGGALAQAGLLVYGQSAPGSIGAQSPLAVYAFQGQAGDLVTVQAAAVTPALDVNLTLLSPAGQQIAASSSDPFSAFGGDARLTVPLPQAGVYSLLVGDLSGAGGDFLLRLSAQQAASAALALVPDASVQLDFPAGGPPQIVSVITNAAPSGLRVTGLAGFPFSAEVRRQTGETLAYFAGAPDVALSLPPDSIYLVTVAALDETAGAVVVTAAQDALPDAGAPLPAPTVHPPAETPEVSAPEETCLLTPGGQQAVNIRSGPGTNFSIIGQLIPGQALIAAGVSGEWYAVQVVGGLGWVAQSVVSAQGGCGKLPVIAGPDAPVQATPTYTPTQPGAPPPTSTYTPSPTQPGAPPPTATHTPTVQPPTATSTATASHTPTVPVPTAPEDARFNSPLNIPLDSTASVTDFVSYPEGDREDRVRYDVTGMNSSSSLPGGRARLILTVSCFGTGTDNIQFFTGGQTFACGQTILDTEVTFDSRTGSVVITAVGGANTYVQWVLTGTATRLN